MEFIKDNNNTNYDNKIYYNDNNNEKYQIDHVDSESDTNYQTNYEKMLKKLLKNSVHNDSDYDLDYDLKIFGRLCQIFSEKQKDLIVNLKSHDRKNFNTAVKLIEKYYNSKHYVVFYENVLKYFKHINFVEKNTVGSYFAGCIVSNNFENSCSATCAGAIQTPENINNGTVCDKQVMFAEKKDNGYNFSSINHTVISDENIYVFVDDMTLESFKGFSLSEKQKMKEIGVKKIFLVGYDEKNNSNTYKNLYDDFLTLDQIKTRDDMIGTYQKSYQTSNLTDEQYKQLGKNKDNMIFFYAYAILLIIAVIVLVLIISFRYN